jgi:hypothetical protein
MFSSGVLDNLIKQVLSQLGQEKAGAGQTSYRTEKTDPEDAGIEKNSITGGIQLEPQKILVILGLLAGVLEVTSVTVSKDQIVEFVLSGTLKRPTRLDKMLDEIGKMPFEDVMRAVMERLG